MLPNVMSKTKRLMSLIRVFTQSLFILYLLQTVKNARGKNPAFDWNNLTMKPSADVKPIFDRFNMAIVYAPCILLDTILVCGQSIEINCLTDLMIAIHTLDMRLMLNIAKAVSNIVNRYIMMTYCSK